MKNVAYDSTLAYVTCASFGILYSFHINAYSRSYFTGKVARGVTQGDPMSPTIFNVVVELVFCQWVTVAIKDSEKRGERGKEGRQQASLFYTDNGMVASSDPRWLKWAFNALVGLFERMGLQTNVGKTVSMVCRPCQAAGNQSEAAYGRKMTGEVPTYQKRQKERVECGECRKEMAAGSLASHRMMQHGKAKEEQWSWEASATGGYPRTYWIAFPDKGGPRCCSVEV